MAYSTTAAIRTALETVIAGLNPGGSPLGSGTYQKAGRGFEWAERPAADVDRRFSVEEIDGGAPTMFGAISEIDMDGSFNVILGHKITSDKHASLGRANTDALQVRLNLEKKTNFPTGVSLIRHSDTRRDSSAQDRLLTTITFRIWFAVAAP